MVGMRWATVPCALCCLAGCDLVFSLDRPDGGTFVEGPASPVTQRTGSRDEVDGSTVTPLDLDVADSIDGHTLVIVAAIESSDQGVQSIVDSAGNLWKEALHGHDSIETAVALRIEIWFAPSALPITSLTVTPTQDRPLAIGYSEWDTFGATVGVAASNALGDIVALAGTTGKATSTENTLWIGTIVSDQPMITLRSDGFFELNKLSVASIECASAARFTKPTSTEATWTLTAQARWNAGIVGFGL